MHHFTCEAKAGGCVKKRPQLPHALRAPGTLGPAARKKADRDAGGAAKWADAAGAAAAAGFARCRSARCRFPAAGLHQSSHGAPFFFLHPEHLVQRRGLAGGSAGGPSSSGIRCPWSSSNMKSSVCEPSPA